MLVGDCVRKVHVTWGKPCARMNARMKTSTANVIAASAHMKPTATRWVLAGETIIRPASSWRAGATLQARRC